MGNIAGKGGAGLKRVSVFKKLDDQVDQEMEEQKLRYHPERLDKLLQSTHFTKDELKRLYQNFKQSSPSGFVTADQFKDVFRQLFCIGHLSDASIYAQLVFDSFDEDGNGRISFSEFAEALSVLNRGTLDQRLEWMFDLYDNKHRRYLMEDDFQRMVTGTYALMGLHWDEENMEDMRMHAKTVFRHMDANRDGKLTLDEFVDGCKHLEGMQESLDILKTVGF